MGYRDEGYELLGSDADSIPDGTRLATPSGTTYVVLRDTAGWPNMLFETADGRWLHAADPLMLGWGWLRNDGPHPDPPTWDDVDPTCCWRDHTT